MDKASIKKIRKIVRFALHRDHIYTVLLTAVIVASVILISVNLSFFNPIKRAFEDFSMTDIYYEILSDNETPALSKQITIVDVTDLHSRCDFAQFMQRLSTMRPAVVGMDLIFEGLKDDDECNNRLVESMFQVPSLIVAAKLTDYNPSKDCFTGITHSYFESLADFPYAYVNVVNNMTFHSLRKYSIFQRLNKDTVYSLPVKIVASYLHKKPSLLIREDNEPVIDYRKDIKFSCIRSDSIQYWPNLINGRIVMLGCMHEEADTHYTPLGKMAGIEVQAYSAQTVLNHREQSQMGAVGGIIFGIIVSYITALGCFIIAKKIKRSPIIIKLYLFAETALIVWIGFYCYVHYNYNVNILYALFAVALTETARFYYANLIAYLKEKKGFLRVRNTIYL